MKRFELVPRRVKKYIGLRNEGEKHREQALQGAQKAQEMHSPQLQHQATGPPETREETRADAQDSSGNAGPTGDVSYRQRQNKTKKTERDPKHISRKPVNTRTDHDKKQPGSRNQHDIAPNESDPSVRNSRGEPGIDPHRHRLRDVGETSEPVGSLSELEEEKMRLGLHNQDDMVPNDIGNSRGEPGVDPHRDHRVVDVGETSQSFQSRSKPEDEKMQSVSWLHDDIVSIENGLPSGNNQGRLSHDPHGGTGVADVGEVPGLSPTKSEDQRIRPRSPNQGDPSNEIYLPDANIPNEPGLYAQDRPRDADIDEVSGPLQGKESQKTEIGHEEDGSSSRAVMNKISHHLNKVKIELPSTLFEREIPRSCSLVDIEMAIAGLIQALQSINRDAHDTKIALSMKTAECESLQTLQTESSDNWAQKSKEFQDRVSTLEREKGEIERDKEICVNNTVSVLRAEHKKIQEEHQSEWNKEKGEFRSSIQQLENEKEMLKDKFEGKVKNLEQQYQEHVIMLERNSEGKIAKIEKDHSNMVLELKNVIEKLKKRHEDEVEELQYKHRGQIDMLRRKMQGEKAQTERDCSNRVVRLEDSLRAEKQQYEMDKKQMAIKYHNDKVAIERNMQTFKNDLHAQMNALRVTHNHEMEEMAREIEKIEKDHKALQKQLIEAHDVEKTMLERQWEEENRSLREHNESLKEALVKRDRFKAMSDRELANRFQDLTSDVDLLSRVRWDNGRVRTWPFPDKSFRNSENPRMDKQYLVQNTIWVILYEKIFCTSFKVLGEAGRSLEQEWIQKYGRGELLV